MTDAAGRRWFRADVEGLRAVAVVTVLAFHAHVPHAGGGFVGVDVFFVISGFLITTLLVREAEATGSVDLAAFFARRARRILPLASLVLAVTTAAAGLLLTPLAAADAARDALAAARQVANVHFAAQEADYSAARPSGQPAAALLVAGRRGAVLPGLGAAGGPGVRASRGGGRERCSRCP